MKRALRYVGFFLLGLVTLVALCAALLGYFVYAPEPVRPPLSGALVKGTMEVGGLRRSYVSYVPRGLPKGAPLVLVLHGSGEGAGEIRVGTGYGFERLADQHGFAVAYPNSASFDWNDCGRVGDFSVDGHEVDDVAFLQALADKFVAEIGIDTHRVFATGVSSGGFMSLRLALEAPARFRAVAAVAADVHMPENFKCHPVGPGTPVMIMNGTKDTLVPFQGGEINLLGLFYKGGQVHSARASAQYFAKRNKFDGAPAVTLTAMADGVSVERFAWHRDGGADVELLAIHGGGHGLPQPYRRGPRLLGPSPTQPDGPALIWDFFARQAH
jgi:polyhydroxybutyrate depolymerase